jgi:hypothetical protein
MAARLVIDLKPAFSRARTIWRGLMVGKREGNETLYEPLPSSRWNLLGT